MAEVQGFKYQGKGLKVENSVTATNKTLKTLNNTMIKRKHICLVLTDKF